MENKVCNECSIEKPLTEFYKRPNGWVARCKECYKKASMKYHTDNKEIVNEKSRLKYNNNPEMGREYSRKYREKYPEKGKEDVKKWREENPEKFKESKAKWLAKNPDYEKERSKRRRKETPHIFAWRDMLKDSLKRLGKKKEGHTIDLLGYSALELKQHIESLFTEGMTWGNHGEWHIDHIKPVITFDPATPSSVVNALSNLQPLWATTREINGVLSLGNLNKGTKLI